MNDIQIRAIHSETDIFNSLSSCANSFFNQRVNNSDTLRNLSKKFSNHGVCHTINVGEGIAGFVSCYVNDTITQKGFLSIIVVKKEFQGFGFGTLLLDIVLSSCKIFGMKQLRLEVDPNNTSAINFYHKRGFLKDESNAHGIINLYKQIH